MNWLYPLCFAFLISATPASAKPSYSASLSYNWTTSKLSGAYSADYSGVVAVGGHLRLQTRRDGAWQTIKERSTVQDNVGAASGTYHLRLKLKRSRALHLAAGPGLRLVARFKFEFEEDNVVSRKKCLIRLSGGC